MKRATLKQSLIQVLKDAKKIADADIERAERMRQEENIRFFDALIKLNLINEKELTSLLSTQCGIPFLNISKIKLNKDLVQLVPERIARRYKLIPVSSVGQKVTVVMADPFNLFAVDDIELLTHFKVDLAIGTEKEIMQAIDDLYSKQVNVADIVGEVGAEGDVIQIEEDSHEVGLTEAEGEARPIVRIVDLILMEACRRGASDIHIEPLEKTVRVRYRIDGVLRETLALPKKNQNALTARLKILSNLDITENRVPQDGRFKIRFGQKELDYRVSMLPVTWGQKVVMRALDKSNLKLGLETIGFSKKALGDFVEAVRKPFGMLLITGPTGSGKSTTLYSILSELNTVERNIITIEDPIEYQLAGITQMQAKPEIGFSFANGLRAILHQSPDVVMLGEIRDSETADIAVKASLTGQVVLSTLHTNDAPSAITRLIDMGVEPFLISSSITLIAAQRLCRKICQSCKEKIRIPKEVFSRLRIDAAKMFRESEPEFYKGRGCDQCEKTGYKGRIAIAETMLMDEHIRAMVGGKCTAQEIKDYAVSHGMITLREDALSKLKEGITTFEEVLRVTAEDET